jgi:alpha-L-fucosidase
MKLTRRDSLKLLASAGPALALRPQRAFAADLPISSGPFKGTRSSLGTYQIPGWFTEAKFGIWSHWGPQSAIEDGDWYARNMYLQGSKQYNYHVKTYGHPSKVGYKDLVPQFKAARWDPDHLMDLYVKAGAKYFFSMGVHHDNYDMWNSKYQKRWNSVATGPNKDIVGIWKNAARKRGLYFGVSEHLSNSYDWLAPSHLSDSTGPLAGVSYDGTLPVYSDLYHDYTGEPADFAKTAQAMGRVAPIRWKTEYFNRVKDLLDQHQPDLLYTDGGIAMEEYTLALVAHLYNLSAKRHGGKTNAIFFSKTAKDCANGNTCVLDRERGVLDDIAAHPWQTDTCIGEWHYHKGITYKSSKKVIDLLVDIVSKNGNLLLNFPLPNSGELDSDEMVTLNGITAWMQVNSEGIYSSRPWKIYGEGPSTKVVIAKNGKEFDPNEGKKPDLGAADVRFTTKGSTLFAFVQGWPANEAIITSLATGSPHAQKITSAHMLGHSESLKFSQKSDGLHVTLPSAKPATADIGITLKLTTA